MVTALVAALMAVLGFGGLMALRYARTRTRFALTVGAVIGAETLALAILFIAVATGKWIDTRAQLPGETVGKSTLWCPFSRRRVGELLLSD